WHYVNYSSRHDALVFSPADTKLSVCVCASSLLTCVCL
ncbi:unnamed protein product, partial [Coregonus sp. 'balchen']